MLDSRIRVLDTSSPEVEAAIKNKDIKSRGYLNIFKRSWTLKPELSDLEQVLDLFDNCSENEEDLILSLGDYLWAVVPGMTEELWKSLEQLAIKKGIISKGGYMNIKEYIREEAWQEGRQEGRQEGIQQGQQKERQQVILNMLKKNAEISFISEVTGLSSEEIKKLQNGN